jgi:hypothetical protein
VLTSTPREFHVAPPSTLFATARPFVPTYRAVGSTAPTAIEVNANSVGSPSLTSSQLDAPSGLLSTLGGVRMA